MITREDLYALVWSLPGTEVAVILDIKDPYLCHICRALEVPRPSRGYWRKLKRGYAVPVPTLPPAGPAARQTWERGDPIGFVRRRKTAEAARSLRKKPPAIVRRSRDMHELAQEAKNELQAAQTGIDGFYLKPSRTLLADLVVSAGGLEKCLRFASLLFNRLEECGHPVEIATGAEILIRVDIDKDDGVAGPNRRPDSPLPWSPRRPTVVDIHAVPLGVSIVEVSETVHLVYVGDGEFIPATQFRKAEHVGHTWDTHRRLPSGRLKLTAYSPYHDLPWRRQWIEKPGSALDDRMEEIVAVLESAAIDLSLRLADAGRFFK
ncbi:hypothetical protein ELH42_13225 [Rhizobium ruizarguesonis]|uniref:hypothetical protein n=1 Tax=Rhizobium ruizarguesonis TaxID=2081791 RepID=UPI001030E24B|nr:hypothetical protein [Rhizobium ruizarguesonis]TBB67060.1 hypothetical protein ELH42_13225 [Rhizobium ruizarguesonis]